MTDTKILLGYPDIKSLLEENDKRASEYAANRKDENALHRLYETFSLILSIVETAAVNMEKETDVAEIKGNAMEEAKDLIDVRLDFNARLILLESRYMQARGIRIKCVT